MLSVSRLYTPAAAHRPPPVRRVTLTRADHSSTVAAVSLTTPTDPATTAYGIAHNKLFIVAVVVVDIPIINDNDSFYLNRRTFILCFGRAATACPKTFAGDTVKTRTRLSQ